MERLNSHTTKLEMGDYVTIAERRHREDMYYIIHSSEAGDELVKTVNDDLHTAQTWMRQVARRLEEQA